MKTGNKIEQRKPEFYIRRKFLHSFVKKTPIDPLIKTILFFLAVFLLISYYYVRPKISVTKNFMQIMSSGNVNEISGLTADCTIYNNKKLNEALKKEYLNQLSYIIQINKPGNFYIKPENDEGFHFDINTNNVYYGNLTKNLSFIKNNGTYKFDINKYIKSICTGSIKDKTALENKLIMRQLVYCYQYYLDDYINKGNTYVFKFIEKNSNLYKYLAEFKFKNSNLKQNTTYTEFKNIKFDGNSAIIDVYQTMRQDKNKIISLKKQNYSYKAVNLNGRWLLNDIE